MKISEIKFSRTFSESTVVKSLVSISQMSLVMRKPDFSICENKDADQLHQISFAVVTAKLIISFVFPKQIVQSLYFLNKKFQVSSHLLWLYSPVYVGPGRKSRRPVFSQRGSNINALASFVAAKPDWSPSSLEVQELYFL